MHARNVCVLIQYTEEHFSEVLRCICSTLPMKKKYWILEKNGLGGINVNKQTKPLKW